MNLEKRIKRIISEKLGIPPEEIVLSSNLTEDLGASPIEIADLLVALEEEFKINFAAEEKEKLKTVQRVINLISSQASEF